MPLPIAFLIGLVCVVIAKQSALDLPREIDAISRWPYLFVMLVPWVGTRILLSWQSPLAHLDRRRTARLLSVAKFALVPSCYCVLLFPGELGALSWQWSMGFESLAFAVAVPPLIVMEWTAAITERRSGRRRGRPDMPGPLHMRLVAFLSIAALCLTFTVDALQVHRDVEVFFGLTALGQSVGALLFAVCMCAMLPLLFRFVLATSASVPPDAKETASLLGFPSADVRVLHTGNRLINAMMVGVLPRLRYLFLTDLLVDVLNPLSLRGVVAHEVGHAKAGHIVLLMTIFLVIPLLLVAPFMAVGGESLDTTGLLAVMAVGGAILLLTLRRVAHRFELEADALSADALGGSTPCILALQRAGELAGTKPDKAGFRHPSEETRIHHLLSCDGDPWYREQFDRGGRKLRRLVMVVLSVVILGSAWAHARLLPLDLAVFHLYTGRFVAADDALASLDRSSTDAHTVEILRDVLAAARKINPVGGAWRDIHVELSGEARKRGMAELLSRGPAAARPWLAVGLFGNEASPLDLSIYFYCRAVAEEELERADVLRQHLLQGFELSEPLREVIAASTG